MGASSASPRARQARAPKDKPRKRVRVTRSPAVLAWSGVKAIASRIGLRVASQASRGLIPLSTSLLCTSARLTVLTASPPAREQQAQRSSSEQSGCRLFAIVDGNEFRFLRANFEYSHRNCAYAASAAPAFAFGLGVAHAAGSGAGAEAVSDFRNWNDGFI